MPAPFVQKANSGSPSGTATTKSVTLNGQVAQNLNLVLVSFGNAAGTTTPIRVQTITDTKGNIYQPASPLSQTTQNSSCIVMGSFYAPQIASGNNTITVTLTGAASFFIISAAEYGIQLASPFGSSASAITNQADTASASLKSGNTYAYNGDLVVGLGCCSDGASAVGAGFTSRDLIYTIYIEDQLAVANGPIFSTGTASAQGGWIAQVLVFRTASSIVSAPGAGEFLLNDPYKSAGGGSGDPTVLQDGNSWTFWGALSGARFAQCNAGAPVILTRIRVGPVAGGEDLPIGCTIQACNDPAFAISPVTIFTFAARMLTGDLVNQYSITQSTPYQYYRLNTLNAASGFTCLDMFASWVSGMIGQPMDIVPSPATGNFDLPTLLTLSTQTTSATIYYTTDGSTPSTASPVASGRILISASCVLKAVAISPSQSANSRTLSRPIHIGATEVSVDNIYDSRNYRLWAMNGNLYQDPVSKYWYRYGTNADTPTYYNYGFAGTMCYRSADLRNWDFRGQLMQPTAGTADTTTNKRWHIAFHILYNALNNNYVAWADTYDTVSGSFTWIGKTVWTSSSAEGPFTLIRTIHDFPGIPTTGANDWGQGDFCLFLDTDGSAYLVSVMGNGSAYNTNLFTARLTTDFQNISATTQISASTHEAPWVFKAGAVYFLFGSGIAAFNSTDCVYATASSIMGPWSGFVRPFQPAAGGPDYTIAYDSQVWQVVTVPGRSQGFIYHGDRYTQTAGAFPNLKRIRVPVVVSGSTLTINWFDAWSFDAKMPPVSGQPAAPSNLVISGTSATWTNNESVAKLYLDMASDTGFTVGAQSLPVPDGSASAIVPSASFYRVRAVNASGSSVSNIVATSSATSPDNMNPPFQPPTFINTVPKGLWNTYTGPQEDGPSPYLPKYNGQDQTKTINSANPISTTVPPAKCTLPGAAVGLSKIP